MRRSRNSYHPSKIASAIDWRSRTLLLTDVVFKQSKLKDATLGFVHSPLILPELSSISKVQIFLFVVLTVQRYMALVVHPSTQELFNNHRKA